MEYNEESFVKFITDIKLSLETHFKIDDAKLGKSKRNALFNPWITPGIVKSINRKQYLYKQWQMSITKNNKMGNEKLYEFFSVFRKKLKGVIKEDKMVPISGSDQYRYFPLNMLLVQFYTLYQFFSKEH